MVERLELVLRVGGLVVVGLNLVFVTERGCAIVEGGRSYFEARLEEGGRRCLCGMV